jgi:hypothetical protein
MSCVIRGVTDSGAVVVDADDVAGPAAGPVEVPVEVPVEAPVEVEGAAFAVAAAAASRQTRIGETTRMTAPGRAATDAPPYGTGAPFVDDHAVAPWPLSPIGQRGEGCGARDPSAWPNAHTDVRPANAFAGFLSTTKRGTAPP